jgi:hypothetical protein
VLFVSENRSNAHRENPYSLNPVNTSILLVKNTVARTSKSLITRVLLKAVRDLCFTEETTETSTRVSDILRNTKDIKNVLDLRKWKKDTVKSILGQIHKKQQALAKYSKALGVRQEVLKETKDIKNSNSAVNKVPTHNQKTQKDPSGITRKTAHFQYKNLKNRNQNNLTNKKQTKIRKSTQK